MILRRLFISLESALDMSELSIRGYNVFFTRLGFLRFIMIIWRVIISIGIIPSVTLLSSQQR